MRRARWGFSLGGFAKVSASVLAVLAALAPSAAEAQSPPAAPETIAVGDWQLAPTLQFRTRGAYTRDPVDLGGGVDPGGQIVSLRVRDAGGILERTRLGLGAERGALRAQLTFQDARAWGSSSTSGRLGVAGTAPASFRPFEAFVEARTSSARPSFFRVGRQVVEWGEGRLLGVADWSPTARSLDAARAHWSPGSGAFEMEMLASLLDSPRPLGSDFGDSFGPARGGDQLYGVSANLTLDPLFRVQLYALAKVARTSNTGAVAPRAFVSARAVGETYTAALRVYGDGKGWRYGLEGAYQLGTVASIGSGGADRQAYAGAAHVSRTFDRVVLAPTFRIGGSLASGDDGSGKYKQFDPILPDVHVFHGAMDAFAWSNMIDASARVTVAPSSETTLAVEYRYAQLMEAGGEWLNAYLTSVGRMTGNTSKDLGHEIDGVLTWAPWTPLQLVLGYSAFFAGDGARAVLASSGRGELQANGTFTASSLTHFAYLQATLRIP